MRGAAGGAGGGVRLCRQPGDRRRRVDPMGGPSGVLPRVGHGAAVAERGDRRGRLPARVPERAQPGSERERGGMATLGAARCAGTGGRGGGAARAGGRLARLRRGGGPGRQRRLCRSAAQPASPAQGRGHAADRPGGASGGDQTDAPAHAGVTGRRCGPVGRTTPGACGGPAFASETSRADAIRRCGWRIASVGVDGPAASSAKCSVVTTERWSRP